MTAITLRNIRPELQREILDRAHANGSSLNRTVIRMLEELVGLRREADRVVHDDLDHLAGTWSADEAAAFDRALSQQRQIDPGLWD